ncbi:hypothetical protein ISG33_14325 [Glaciecola sp. MH2013]|uniref:hypothetical protein n=1 Tax=Glaciecola sp. MH2013 TaxID=2785524 RepID=UPI0018A0E126|nr:hypothetical protein [Glaciecola sp. MH2013]MBF7074578.1 hypothetical protein [Glaciecola sp. MH2013]
MVGYKWTCNACSSSNEAGVDVCAQCGCHATASSDDIDRHRDPEGHRRRKLKQGYEKKLTSLLFLPLAILIFLVNGRLELLLLAILVLVASMKFNSELFKFLFSESFLTKSLLISSGTISLLLLLRVFFIPNDSVYIWIPVFGFAMTTLITYYALFKSTRGEKAFEKYFQQNDS